MGLVSVLGWMVWDLATLPSAEPLARTNPRTTALMMQRDREAQEAGARPRRRQQWVPLSQVPRHVRDAIVVSEDSAFWKHEGVDTVELRKALEESWAKGRLTRGASTITQQLAKNLWLSTDRSLWRKAKEVLLARRLERALTKQRILELYVNLVEWGDGLYGVEAAARHHFGVGAAALTPAQGAILAAMLPAPRTWVPAKRPPVLHRRAGLILDRLAHVGRLSGPSAAAARSELDALLASASSPAAPPPPPTEVSPELRAVFEAFEPPREQDPVDAGAP